MDTKNFSLKALDEEGTGQAVIARLGVIDRDGDVIVKGAFGTQHVAVVPSHDATVAPLGKAVVSEKGDQAVADFRFNLDTVGGREWNSHLKFDLANGQPVQQWSFRFNPVRESQGEFEGQKVRFLEEIELAEVSPVLIGAGIGTHTIQVKRFKRSESFIREYAENPEKLTAKSAAALIDILNNADLWTETWAKDRANIYEEIAAHVKAAGQEAAALLPEDEWLARRSYIGELVRYEQTRFERSRE
jgi:phage head maturation protease